MTLHLIKMAAGISSLQELEERQAYIRGLKRPELAGHRLSKNQIVHITRFFPKRRDEILFEEKDDNGSLFWVFQKRIQARQTIADFIEVTTEQGLTKCGIVLEGPLVAVERHIRPAFQGWRYLTGDDAPQDLSRQSINVSKIPAKMRHDLEELCLI